MSNRRSTKVDLSAHRNQPSHASVMKSTRLSLRIVVTRPLSGVTHRHIRRTTADVVVGKPCRASLAHDLARGARGVAACGAVYPATGTRSTSRVAATSTPSQPASPSQPPHAPYQPESHNHTAARSARRRQQQRARHACRRVAYPHGGPPAALAPIMTMCPAALTSARRAAMFARSRPPRAAAA